MRYFASLSYITNYSIVYNIEYQLIEVVKKSVNLECKKTITILKNDIFSKTYFSIEFFKN
jgi:hypothetical protein